jgi:DNA replication protein DnaC
MKDPLQDLAVKLGFHAVAANWQEYSKTDWIKPLLLLESEEKDRRNLDTRMNSAQIGNFKPMVEYDWSWPDSIDRDQVEDLFTLDFLKEGANVALVGTEGLGKSMIMQNLAHEIVIRGHKSKFVKASKMLNDLFECNGRTSRQGLLNRLCRIEVLCIDEIGYMSYDSRYADLLYEVIAERYNKKSTIISTNLEFNKWSEIFPSAPCVVTLVDKLVHRSEIVVIKGKSYRLHEATLREEAKSKARKAKARAKAKQSK